jgi:hypothetical protein
MVETRADLESKAARRKLRELAGVAYARELGAELVKLEAEFSRWRGGEIDPFELSDRIHRFHEGKSQQLFVFYDGRNARVSVARAIAEGILERAEVPADLLGRPTAQHQIIRESIKDPCQVCGGWLIAGLDTRRW